MATEGIPQWDGQPTGSLATWRRLSPAQKVIAVLTWLWFGFLVLSLVALGLGVVVGLFLRAVRWVAWEAVVVPMLARW